jgi:hypothetical protein
MIPQHDREKVLVGRVTLEKFSEAGERRRLENIAGGNDAESFVDGQTTGNILSFQTAEMSLDQVQKCRHEFFLTVE